MKATKYIGRSFLFDECNTGNYGEDLESFRTKLGLQSPIAHGHCNLHSDPCLIVTINAEKREVALWNLHVGASSESFALRFTSDCQFSENSDSTVIVVFNKQRVIIGLRKPTYLENYGVEWIEAHASATLEQPAQS